MTDDLQICEACDVRAPIETMTPTDDDCYLCLTCHAEATRAFDACEHAWEASRNKWGDAAHACLNCSHIVADADFFGVFGRSAPSRETA